MTYHKDVTGIPAHLTEARPGQMLRYSDHAYREADRDRAGVLPRYLPPVFETVELTEESGVVVKWLVRIPCHARRTGPDGRKVWYDLCLVVTPDGMVKTVWLNNQTDTHTTLNRAAYGAPRNQ